MGSSTTYTTQACRACGETQPIDEFDVRADTGKYRTQCKRCRRAYQRGPVAPERVRSHRVVWATEPLRCRICHELKAAIEFPRRGRDSHRLHTWCKPCFAAYKAARHQLNHEREMLRIRRNQAIRVAANRAKLLEHLLTHPCVDCGETDVVVLDLDHVRGKKLGDVSRMVTNGHPWAKIEAEIAKCEVRCANDHRRVTAMRREMERRSRSDPGAARTPDLLFRRQPL